MLIHAGQATSCTSIGVYVRKAAVRVATTSTSCQAHLALERAVAIFGSGITILNDNGSENHGEAYAYIKDLSITQHFARPRPPKDKTPDVFRAPLNAAIERREASTR